jgi:hypothetical protein
MSVCDIISEILQAQGEYIVVDNLVFTSAIPAAGSIIYYNVG